jgi:hypothetical protein
VGTTNAQLKILFPTTLHSFENLLQLSIKGFEKGVVGHSYSPSIREAEAIINSRPIGAT